MVIVTEGKYVSDQTEDTSPVTSSVVHVVVGTSSRKVQIKNLLAEAGISMGVGGAANAAALMKCTSTTQGFGLPAMTTTQRDAISSPPDGLLIFNTTTGTANVYDTFVPQWVAL